MSNPITIFTGSSGLNTVSDPVRIGQRGGVVDLQAAVNVSIDSSGRVRSRRGVTRLQTGAFHSLFCDGGDCFVVRGDTLYQMAADGSLSVVRSGLTQGRRMAYARVGDRTYYTNGFELGIIQGGVHLDWTDGVYIGPDTHRQFRGPFPGEHLAEFFGRMMIVTENVLWWSEPYDYGLYDMASGFVQFHTRIVMVKPMDAGLFLSTERHTWFLAGTDPAQWTARKVAGYPAIEWTCAVDYLYAADLGMETPGRCAVWASTEGAIMGTPDGGVINLNKHKIIYPETGRAGFGGLVGYNFIHGVQL